MSHPLTAPAANTWNLLGHDWAADMLRQHIVRGDLRHAYLFCGPPGVGRRTLALRLVQALNCAAPSAPGVPCGGCRTCQRIEAMQFPDLSVIETTDKDLNPDPNGIIRVDQIRELRKTILLKPYLSSHRAALLLRFQESNDNAANALLKTLEESPAHAILLLTADAPEQLLPTVVSRCEVVRLRPVPVELIESDLTARGVDQERAHLMAHLSGGRPGYARRLADDPSLLERREEQLNDLQMLLRASLVEKFSYADKLTKDKVLLRRTILVWLSYWRDVLLSAANAHTPPSNIDRRAEIERIAARLTLTAARQIVSELENALDKIDRNVNAKLLAEVLLMDWPKI